MATYTTTQLKALTSVPSVSSWEDDAILIIQTSAESILNGLGMDTTMPGYQSAYDASVLLLFDWIANNRVGVSSRRQGKVSFNSYDGLPPSVKSIVDPFVAGSCGTFTPANLNRQDIGLY